MTYVKSIILIIVLLFFVTFGVKNSQPTPLNYYFNITTGMIPLYGIVYICIVIGVVIGMIVGALNRISLMRKVRQVQQENKELREKMEKVGEKRVQEEEEEKAEGEEL